METSNSLIYQYSFEQTHGVPNWDGKVHVGTRQLNDGRFVVLWISPWEDPFIITGIRRECLPGTYIFSVHLIVDSPDNLSTESQLSDNGIATIKLWRRQQKMAA